jgi:predicted naringenin-chalcone synthase
MSSILGLGTATPAGSVSQEESLTAARTLSCLNGQERLLPILYRRTSIARRSSILVTEGTTQTLFTPATTAEDRGPGTADRLARYRASAPNLAAEAASRALAEATTDPAEITHLVTASCTGFDAPGVDCHLIQRLGLPPTTLRTHVGFMGCHAAINALRVAHAFARDPAARILVCCVEVCTIHYSYAHDPDKLVANAIFADGAAAAVVGGGMPIALDRHAQDVHGLHILDTASCILPDSADAMTWAIGDHGFEMTLSPRVPDLLRAHLHGWLSAWLARHDLTPSEIPSWAIHPGGPRIISTVAECLALSPDQTAPSRAVMADHGNMSSPTVLFILDRLLRSAAPRPIVALAFGPGLVAEGALLG